MQHIEYIVIIKYNLPKQSNISYISHNNLRVAIFFDMIVSDWKSHKAKCKVIAADIAQADSHELHKKEFDRIRTKYGLTSPEQAEKIANLLANTDANEGVSAPKFAEMFGMTVTEAVVFLEWIKVGIKFKEETLDTAKKAGLS